MVGRPFEPGQSGNPGGRPKADPELKALRELTSEHFKELANLVLLGDRAAIKTLEADDGAPLFKRWLARMAGKGFDRGDQQVLDWFVTRLIGRVPERIESKNEHTFPELGDEARSRLEALQKPDGS